MIETVDVGVPFASLQSAQLIMYRFVNDYPQNKHWLDLKLSCESVTDMVFFFSLACRGASVFCHVLMRLCVILLCSETPWTCFRQCPLTPQHCQKLWRCGKTSSVYKGKALTHPLNQTWKWKKSILNWTHCYKVTIVADIFWLKAAPGRYAKVGKCCAAALCSRTFIGWIKYRQSVGIVKCTKWKSFKFLTYSCKEVQYKIVLSRILKLYLLCWCKSGETVWPREQRKMREKHKGSCCRCFFCQQITWQNLESCQSANLMGCW